LHQEGYQIVLVSSGAIAAGREVMPVQNYPPQELIQKVASKGGTTEAALQYLRQHKTDLTFQEALRCAYRRAQDLSK
jgi:pyrroline-5-carboxylate reductase